MRNLPGQNQQAVPLSDPKAVFAEMYTCSRIDSTLFELDGVVYPVGSWLVKEVTADYARAMTAAEFVKWRSQMLAEIAALAAHADRG